MRRFAHRMPLPVTTGVGAKNAVEPGQEAGEVTLVLQVVKIVEAGAFVQWQQVARIPGKDIAAVAAGGFGLAQGHSDLQHVKMGADQQRTGQHQGAGENEFQRVKVVAIDSARLANALMHAVYPPQ